MILSYSIQEHWINFHLFKIHFCTFQKCFKVPLYKLWTYILCLFLNVFLYYIIIVYLKSFKFYMLILHFATIIELCCFIHLYHWFSELSGDTIISYAIQTFLLLLPILLFLVDSSLLFALAKTSGTMWNSNTDTGHPFQFLTLTEMQLILPL